MRPGSALWVALAGMSVPCAVLVGWTFGLPATTDPVVGLLALMLTPVAVAGFLAGSFITLGGWFRSDAWRSWVVAGWVTAGVFAAVSFVLARSGDLIF